MNEQNPWDDCFPVAGDPGALEALYLRRVAGSSDGTEPFSPDPLIAEAAREPAARSLITAFRDRGHLAARLDPLERDPSEPPGELDPAAHGLDPAQAKPLVERLKALYCGSLGLEFSHSHAPERRRWLADQAEAPEAYAPGPEAARAMLALLTRAHLFEEVMAKRLPGAKLFGLGGAESFLVALETILSLSAGFGMEEVVIGGMHRGRFNMLTNIAGKSLTALVAEITGRSPALSGLARSGDVSYHLGYSGERQIAGRTIRFSVSPHPSHLQIIPLISLGRARAKQSRMGAAGRRAVLPLLVHTDAGFSGQGIMMEMFQLARLTPFDVGGAVHVIIDNQVGFTTDPEDGRSSRYCSDVGKIAEAPVIHVNGDDVNAVYRAAALAAGYRAEFGSDVVLEIVCYRRPGHNEIDEPRFTQPAKQRLIETRTPVHLLYRSQLERNGIAAKEAANAEERAYVDAIKAAFDAASSYQPNAADCFGGAWRDLRAGSEAEMTRFFATGLPLDRLKTLGKALTSQPKGFALEPKAKKFLEVRGATIQAGDGINWASAEALALASLLHEGTSVRLGGQDTVRGAFTQRHLFLHDQVTGVRHSVLAEAASDGARAEIFNTPLAEYSVLAFEYGHSLADPHTLVVWEAQFGDFLNVAQPVFDQCMSCGEDRWLRSSGLVVLLPHGIDGGGPDHSTGRPERLLAACADGNLQIINASTPANYFHALRRQMHRPFRKPLVILTPKLLLRHKDCVSALADFGPGTGFRSVLPDETSKTAKRVVVCTGKVYYALAKARHERGFEKDVALIRVEQLYPFPHDALAEIIAPYKDGEIVWCQEEPRNMGYYEALDRTLEDIAGKRVAYIGRPAVASPAVGTKKQHEAQEQAIIERVFEIKARNSRRRSRKK